MRAGHRKQYKKERTVWSGRMSGSDMSGSDDASANTRCSPKHIAQVVSKFGGLKKKLVSDICFKGMLKVPAIWNLDRKFSLSLLEKIDIKKRSLKLNDTTFIEISAKDVQHFLDIPNGPMKLFGLEDRSPSEKMDFIRFGIGSSTFDIDEKNSLKAAEEIVTADYPNGMTLFQAEQFKVSFVCFCMGNFLVAKYSSNHGIKDYWGSLMEPSEISSYDFCQAIVDELMEAARHVQREKKAKRPVKNFSGCHFLLQAKFLGSINLGILNIEDGPSPRIEAFTFSVMNEMKIYLRQNSSTIKSKQIASSAIVSSAIVKDEGQKPDVIDLTSAKTLEGGIRQDVTPASIIRVPSTPSKKIYQETYDVACLSNDKKGKQVTTHISSYVDTIKKPRSTEYLAAYTRTGSEKRLNDKQVNDLRLHNSRMKLLINSFKSSTLSEMDCSQSSNQTCKEVFSIKVNKLMEDILDQVLDHSKRMHEHTPFNQKLDFISPSFIGSSKRSYKELDSGYDGGNDGAPIKRERAGNFNKVLKQMTGKNLIYDLTTVDDPCTDSDKNEAVPTLGFLTPISNNLRLTYSENSAEMLSIGSEKLVFPKMVCNLDNEPKTTCSSSILDRFSTPHPLKMLISNSPTGRGQYSDSATTDMNAEDTIDLELNLMPWNPEMTYSPIIKIPISKGQMAKNPWFYGAHSAVVDKEAGDTFYNWLSVTEDVCLDSWWIKHSSPSYKHIAGNDFKSVFPRRHNFSDDLFDVAIRRFGQRDRNMYGEGVKLRWMHPFETDFAKKVMNDEDYLNSKSIRLQITGKSDEYDISNCRMVAVPHKSTETWSAYLWDMKERIVHVIDPTFDISRACELNDLHEPIVLKLHEAIQKCFGMSYIGWEVDWDSWKKYYVQPFLAGKTSTDSGMLTLLALRQFNGTRFEVPQTEVSLINFARDFLYDMLSLEGNLGILPDVFIQAIE